MDIAKLIEKLRKMPSYTSTPSTTTGDPSGSEETGRISEQKMHQFFDDMDSGEKVGYPYVGLFGSCSIHGKCPQCDKPVYENRIGDRPFMFCPYCRKQLYRSIDDSGRFNVNYELDGGQTGFGFNTPLPSDLPYDQGDFAGSGARDTFKFGS